MTRKIQHLEGLRGLAAFSVFLGHFILGFMPQRHGLLNVSIPGGNLMETPWFAFINGKAAVTLFFVLSGFVLSLYLWNEKGNVYRAAIKRWPRLFPLVLISTLSSYILYETGGYFYDAASKIVQSVWMYRFAFSPDGGDFVASLSDGILQGGILTFLRGDHWLNTSLWTMKYEFYGSLFVFAFVAISRQLKPVPFIACTVISGVILSFQNVYYLAFLAGAVLSFIYTNIKLQDLKLNRLTKITLLLLSLVILGFHAPAKGFYNFMNYFESQGVIQVISQICASTTLIFLAIHSNKLSRFLSSFIPAFLGRVSFAFYVMHIPLLFSASAYLFVSIIPKVGYTSATAITFLFSLVFTLFIAYLLTLMDERWCRKLNQWVKKI